jgi:hypothetical protein
MTYRHIVAAVCMAPFAFYFERYVILSSINFVSVFDTIFSQFLFITAVVAEA